MLILCMILYMLPFAFGKVQDVLKNLNRLSVFNYVSNNPGCTFTDISERRNMNIGTVKYHVLKLESQRKIILRRMGRYIGLFNGIRANGELEKTVLGYIKNDTSKSLLYAIMEEPGITNGKLSDKFGLDKSSIHWHIKRFINDRLVTFEQDGKNKRYFFVPEAIKYLNHF
jgi:predicted transcriptional regulator